MVKALMQSLEAQEICRCPGCCCGAFRLPRYGRCIVGAARDGTFVDVKVVRHDVVLDDAGGEFKVGICDPTFRVFMGHKFF